MKRIAGVISKKSGGKNIDKVKRMLLRLDHVKSEQLKALKLNGSVLGECGTTIPKDRNIALNADIAIVIDGRIYNLDRLIMKYGLGSLKGKSQEEKIFALYEKKGEAIFKEFKGSYAIVLKCHEDFILTRDVIGKKPLYFSISPEEDMLFFRIRDKSF